MKGAAWKDDTTMHKDSAIAISYYMYKFTAHFSSAIYRFSSGLPVFVCSGSVDPVLPLRSDPVKAAGSLGGERG